MSSSTCQVPTMRWCALSSNKYIYILEMENGNANSGYDSTLERAVETPSTTTILPWSVTKMLGSQPLPCYAGGRAKP